MNSKRLSTGLSVLIALVFAGMTARAAEPLKVGDAAPDFTLNTLDGKSVSLSTENAKQPVVLLVLRGWPGYQCPLCTLQVHDYVAQAEELSAKSRVIMVYPGPADELKAHAADFLKNKDWPEKFLFVTDPDYAMTKSYDLRWEGKGETAYPSTFVIDSKGRIQFAKISKSHGGRTKPAEALKALAEIK